MRRGSPIVKVPSRRGAYLTVQVIDDSGQYHTRDVHRLVIETFKGPPPTPDHEARHLDGHAQNNLIANLEWGLPVQNAADRRRHGRYDDQPCGERHHNARLNEGDIREILCRLDAGQQQKDIAPHFGVSASQIGRIARGVKWAKVVSKIRREKFAFTSAEPDRKAA
ncbi:MAG: HNH endonuclease [Tepidisphaeraceae bacterium]